MAEPAQTGWEFWIDRGGTFTDIVARDPAGEVSTHKLLSENPEQYRDAAVAGIRKVLGIEAGAAIPKGLIRAVKMGTTVATNALLERKGTPTILLITRGFGDLPVIGDQTRPRLFDLEIIRPSLLQSRTVEISERMDAQGAVLAPLDEDAVRSALRQAKADGIEAVAVAFLHSFRNPAHEQRAAEIAAELGFTQITISAEASPLIKLLGRGDTTVVDAYLSPILRRYVEQVAGALQGGAERLLFMQSNGGLTDAALFRGKDAILSGPAGGIVGMVKTGEAAGHTRLIGFDMGGTSTDVSHYSGSYERSFETLVAGVRMRAPMMDIHTVAAGGGSICSFLDGRFQVGPESAGADPGPAAYRRGGPLTVTDCNVMLGKLSPEHFPAVFGPKADQPLDADIVREKFTALAERIAAETGQSQKSPEETAQGFLRIAVDNMALAIKKISVERGHDVTGYTLQCFGGAGGQHACLVADALGMTKVLIHPYAGVLSAFGIGLADIRVLKEAQADILLENVDAEMPDRLAPLEHSARSEVTAQGVPETQIALERTAYLKYAGTDQALGVPSGPSAEMQAAFEQAHLSRFGFISPERQLVVEMLAVEAIGQSGAEVSEGHAHGSESAAPLAHLSVAFEPGRAETPLYQRSGLAAGQRIDGPAIILEPTGTTVVEPGWAAEVDALANLVLTRTAPRTETAAGTEADPVLLEVMGNLYMSIAEQMGVSLANTSVSVNIKERFDFSCAVFDGAGDLVANAPHVPVHLGSMSHAIKTVKRLFPEARPGDAYVLNAPYNGGTHLPDVTVVAPVFVDGRAVFWLGARGHHADIGGRTPGSAPPDSTRLEEEGVVIEPQILVSEGRFLEAEARALLASGPYPARNIDHNIADLKAQVAACETGRQELEKMVSQFGRPVVEAYMGHVQDNAEESVRRVIGALKDGHMVYPMDEGRQIEVRVTVDHEARSAVVDFTGTAPQQEGNYNAPLAVCRAVVLYVFRTLVDRDIPLNEGCLKPIEIRVPERSMLNPGPDAAVISGNTEVSQAACNALYGALGVIAGSQATMNNFVWGNEEFQNYETIAGGTGAGPGFNGCDGVQTHMTNTKMTDPEVLEARFPVRLEHFGFREGSAGVGEWTGGMGTLRRLRFLTPVTVTTLCSHREVPPFGGDGGAPGAVGENWAELPDGTRMRLKGNSEIDLPEGAVYELRTPGGGGWGRA